MSSPEAPAGGTGAVRAPEAPVAVEVSDAGIRLIGRDAAMNDVVLDVFFDDRRIWSFWPVRDAERVAEARLVEWPRAIVRFLSGDTRLRLAVHDSEQIWFDGEVTLSVGDGPGGRIAVVDHDGHPLALDKSMRRVRTFETRTAEQVAPLMDAIGQTLAALRAAGVEGFLAYGTLLGAVRQGTLIGHDSDADLGYVSEHEHPVDVMRESFELQRRLTEMGYPTMRYSGAAFKVDVREADGSVRGLDVFGGFMREGYLYLMGEIRTPFKREWVFPLGEATLEGRAFPVPADTDRFLAATYGPHWRTPDPAFKFETPNSTHRRLNGWFRGIRVHRGTWDGAYAAHPVPASLEPSEFVRWIVKNEPDVADFVDVGCGYGVDARWMAERGVASLGLDHAPKGFEYLAEVSEGLPPEAGELKFGALNLLELRSLLSVCAGVARRPGDPRIVAGRHLLDALDARGRQNFYRGAHMMLRGGGRLYLEFLVHRGEDGYTHGKHIRPLAPAKVRAELEAAGATVLRQRRLLASADETAQDRSVISRMVATWQ